ncbi:helix-turn-helix domain-containing protein [Streptomyces himalayensis]|uniref:Helix-turn-helix transcriptional regulator n=1 Tax=Streptomyces himalayensis subsp. himalayensis TaxID=2756131 RepID=A0A7W0DP80_9ACTN|nr:XRE family transcriptional regulator [Streptomyces himalayensis]MBA2947979.1 helix-turn-helix transcriptional regulator [Streptomyces himalayensis subsp. himalayensis]
MSAQSAGRKHRTTGSTSQADLDMAMRTELGATIRRLRKEGGLTLVELAERSELSHPFLSQLERGLARPSMQSLHRIARALGTSQQALLALSAGPPATGRAEEGVHLVRSGEGMPVAAGSSGIARVLGASGFAVHPVEFTWASKCFEEYYDHAGDEFLYVVEGELEVDLGTTQGQQLHRLGPGDSLCYAGRTPHRWRALGETDRVRILMVQNVTGSPAKAHGEGE